MYIPPKNDLPPMDWKNYQPPPDGPRWESRLPGDEYHYPGDNPATDLPDPRDPKEGTTERSMDPVPDEPELGE